MRYHNMINDVFGERIQSLQHLLAVCLVDQIFYYSLMLRVKKIFIRRGKEGRIPVDE
jgi:hypothetical protein